MSIIHLFSIELWPPPFITSLEAAALIRVVPELTTSVYVRDASHASVYFSRQIFE